MEFTATASTASTPIDWPVLKAEILAGLDVAREYEALGVEFTRPADSKGRRECRGVRNGDNPDDRPSAVVFLESGRYKDSGNGGESLSFFDFAAKYGRFGRWTDVVKHYAQKAGVVLGKFQARSGGSIRESMYLYRDGERVVRYVVFRYRSPNGKKTFSQHPPDGKGGWKHGAGCMDGVEPLPYRLPELLADLTNGPVFVVEGEKDADTLAAVGLVATTSHGGTGSAEKVWARIWPHFAERNCVVLPDHDLAGRRYALIAAGKLKDVAATVKVVQLPGLSPGGDVSDWLELGNTVPDLIALCDRAPVWNPGDPPHGEALDQPAATAGAWGSSGTEAEPSAWFEPMLDVQVPVRPFPADLFPAELADFIVQTAEGLTCAPDYLGLSCLVVASGAMGRSVAVALKEGWVETGAIFGAIVGDPGAAKSPAMRLAARPLGKIAETLTENHRIQAEDAKKAKETVPHPQRLLVEDSTVEALGLMLEQNQRGLVMIRDELTALVNSLNQYKPGGKGADRDFINSIWAGTRVLVNRKNNESPNIHIRYPFLSILGALTPDMISELNQAKGKNDGFLDRFLFVFPDPVALHWHPNGFHRELGERWRECVDLLWSRKMIDPIQPEDHPRPFIARLTPDAAAVFGDWYETHVAGMADLDFPGFLAGPWAKFRTYCGRLALVVAMVWRAYERDCGPTQIDVRAMEAAIQLVEYFKSHTWRARVVARGGSSPNEHAMAILTWLRTGGRTSFSESEANRRFPGRFQNNRWTLLDCLEWLQARRCIRAAAKDASKPKRGRPNSTVYDVNPFLFSVPETPPD